MQLHTAFSQTLFTVYSVDCRNWVFLFDTVRVFAPDHAPQANRINLGPPRSTWDALNKFVFDFTEVFGSFENLD